MLAEPAVRTSYEDYLALERDASTKHEYVGGTIMAMAGGSPEHARLAGSLARLLGNAVEGRPCAVFSSDLRVRVVETDRATYPDLTVVCGCRQTAPDDDDAIVELPSIEARVAVDDVYRDPLAGFNVASA